MSPIGKFPGLKSLMKLKKLFTPTDLSLNSSGGFIVYRDIYQHSVASSIIFGLGQLIIIFAFIAWVVSKSLRIALAITLSICVIPVIVLGMIGWLHVPLDIISAPACNIALGLGIDSMIHMVRAFRRQKSQNIKDVEAWIYVRHRFWQPVLTFTLVMVLGFGIFTFSEFPSTQRFGAAVVIWFTDCRNDRFICYAHVISNEC